MYKFILLAIFILIFNCKETGSNPVKSTAGFYTVSQTEWLEIASKNPNTILLDVRTPEENEQSNIAGSLLIPLNELESIYNELPKDKLILLYCRTGSRSAVAADILSSKGYTNLYNLKGGILSWRNHESK